jgi:c-di-GMP-binding flagellar brake protein YcgR
MAMLNELNRRHALRHNATLAITVQPVDAQRKPTDQPFSAVSLDLSQSGLRICADRPLLSDLVLVEIQAAELDYQVAVLGKRVRCQRRGGFYDIGVEFTEKVALSSE